MERRGLSDCDAPRRRRRFCSTTILGSNLVIAGGSFWSLVQYPKPSSMPAAHHVRVWVYLQICTFCLIPCCVEAMKGYTVRYALLHLHCMSSLTVWLSISWLKRAVGTCCWVAWQRAGLILIFVSTATVHVNVITCRCVHCVCILVCKLCMLASLRQWFTILNRLFMVRWFISGKHCMWCSTVWCMHYTFLPWQLSSPGLNYMQEMIPLEKHKTPFLHRRL